MRVNIKTFAKTGHFVNCTTFRGIILNLKALIFLIELEIWFDFLSIRGTEEASQQ